MLYACLFKISSLLLQQNIATKEVAKVTKKVAKVTKEVVKVAKEESDHSVFVGGQKQ